MTLDVRKNYELKQHTTFKIGGCAPNVFFPTTIEELISAVEKANNPVILGGCSNVLISSEGIEEDIIITSEVSDFIFEETKLTVNCGAKGPLLSKEAQKLGLSGFEFMIGFPGTIGGMITMNASAHNQAIENCFISCNVYDRKSKTIVNISKKEMQFKYRNSILSSKNYILLNAQFELTPADRQTINDLMKRNLEFRSLRQPSLKLPNVGSTFKNPENDSAGRLLDIAGAKHLTVGGAKVWENHANFIVNTESATSGDVLNLMYKMYELVKEKYTIELHPEVKFIGIKNTEEEKIWQILSGKNTQMIQK